MATSKEFIAYLQGLYAAISDVTFRPMMGEYLVYYRGRLVGDICDSTLFVKPVNAAKSALPDAEFRPPYNGAKDMIVVDDIENVDFIKELFEAMYPELPEPKKRAKRG